MKNRLASWLGCLLVLAPTLAIAEVNWDDPNLHRGRAFVSDVAASCAAVTDSKQLENCLRDNGLNKQEDLQDAKIAAKNAAPPTDLGPKVEVAREFSNARLPSSLGVDLQRAIVPNDGAIQCFSPDH